MIATPQTTLQVLFVGNSFTARNNMPGLIARLAEAHGLGLRQRLISAGGASLRLHWNKGEAAETIRRGRYDWVVLQEQSTLPLRNRARMHENIRLFDQVIRAAGARTALYLTWARQNAPDAQAAITEAYTSIGREIGAAVVPVGIAWQQFLRGHDRPRLHDRDKSHPSLAGSYLAACVFFGVLFGRSPVGTRVDVPKLDPADAVLLQRAAEEIAAGGWAAAPHLS